MIRVCLLNISPTDIEKNICLIRPFGFNLDRIEWVGDEYKCDYIDLENLLYSINARIEHLLDKDHCIGHSYFMSIKNKNNPETELKEIFRDKIIPLMQEYFYGDMGKVGLILGKSFVVKKYDGTKIKFKSGDFDSLEQGFEEKTVFEITDSFKWDFADIYA